MISGIAGVGIGVFIGALLRPLLDLYIRWCAEDAAYRASKRTEAEAHEHQY